MEMKELFFLETFTHIRQKVLGNFHVPDFTQMTWKGTRKFPCTLTQITCKEEHGNFHVSS